MCSDSLHFLSLWTRCCGNISFLPSTSTTNPRFLLSSMPRFTLMYHWLEGSFLCISMPEVFCIVHVRLNVDVWRPGWGVDLCKHISRWTVIKKGERTSRRVYTGFIRFLIRFSFSYILGVERWVYNIFCLCAHVHYKYGSYTLWQHNWEPCSKQWSPLVGGFWP